MPESVHDKLKRVRRPRVHITYNVQVGDAIEKRELPFVVGVMGDLSGDRDPNKPLPKVRDRKFVKIDRDDFDQVMSKVEPRLQLSATNTLQNDDTELKAELKFTNMADFSPENVAKQIPALRDMLELRTRLANLRSNLYGNERLDELLHQIIERNSPDAIKPGAKPMDKETS